MAAPVSSTAEIVRAHPDDGNRYESVHGELLALVERGRMEWAPPGVGQPLSVSLPQLFRPI